MTSGQDNNRLRPLEVARCSLCGVERPRGLLVPDGGGACIDIHWYCKDVKSCTDRWITARQRQPRRWPASRDDVFAAARKPEPAGMPADDPGGLPEQAQSATEPAVT